MTDATIRPVLREADCRECGGAGTVWVPRHEPIRSLPRSISCPRCDDWNKAQAIRALPVGEGA